MANSSTQPEESKIHDANHQADSCAPNAVISEVPELSILQEFISSPGSAEEEVTEGSISGLLKQLETADSVAQGVESKLDKLLEDIEGLLEGLEGVQGAQQEDQNGRKSP